VRLEKRNLIKNLKKNWVQTVLIFKLIMFKTHNSSYEFGINLIENKF
jgi:hypothetical protein